MPDSPPIHNRRSTDIEMNNLRAEVNDLKDSVEKLTKSVEGLVEAWNTAKGITSFVKWLAGVVVACVSVWAVVTGKKP